MMASPSQCIRHPVVQGPRLRDTQTTTKSSYSWIHRQSRLLNPKNSTAFNKNWISSPVTVCEGTISWNVYMTCGHCASKPITAKRFFSAIELFGGRLPSPVLDRGHTKGEYLTLLRIEFPSYGRKNLDYGVPSGNRGVCEKGCDYVFLSAADERRHNTLVHSKKYSA